MSPVGLAGMLVGLAFVERFVRRLPWKRGGGAASATGLDELTALFYATKHCELEQHRIELVLREDIGDGDRLRFELDEPAGTVSDLDVRTNPNLL
jgi:hypothetical protein